MTTTAEKIRSADETLATAENAMGKARSGLHAAEEVAIQAEKVKRSPLAMTIGAILALTIIGAIVMMLRDDS